MARAKNPREKNNGANLGFEQKLWQMADKLRGHMDAAEYKHVVLGLIFLKYISDAFQERHEALEKEPHANPEDRDEYTAENVFWVPKAARWPRLQDNAKQSTIGKLIDDAMVLIEKENPSLKGVLPKDYNRPSLDKHRVGELIDLIGTIGLGDSENRSKDILGRVYEYFLSQFASAEGKKGGEFYTPRCVGLPIIKITELKYGTSKETSRFSGVYDTKHLLEKGDLLFAWSGNPETSLDVFWWNNGKALLNQHVFRVLPREGIDKEYLFYLLRFLRPTFIRTARDKATSMGHVKVSDLKRLVAFLPSFDEQRVIGQFLSSLDKKVESNRRMNETLEAIARAIFESWFVNFDPVRAKAEGRPFGLDTEIASLFPDSFQDSPLGMIPKGWGIGILEEMVQLQRGFDLPNDSRTPGQYPVISASGPTGTHIEWKVKGPGVVTGRSGLIGKFFYIQEDFWPLNTTLWVKEFRKASPIYAFHLLKRLNFDSYNAGSAVPTLNRNHVHNLPVLIPDSALVDHFEKLVCPAYRVQQQNERQSRTLISIRDMLLPKLISGEIRVKEGVQLEGRAV